MITYTPHSKIDKKKWDHCVDNDPEAQVFFYSWFLDTVCDRWDGLVAGDYEAVFAIPFKRKLGIYYIVQPFFTRTVDICSSEKKWKNTGQFISCIPSKFKLQEFCISPSQMHEKDIIQPIFKTYQAILLNKPYSILKKNFSTNTLQNLRKAEKNELLIQTETDTKIIADNFKKLKGKDLIKFGKKEFQLLKKLMDVCLLHHHGYTRSVINTEGELIASAFFMHAHDRIIYLKGSTSEKGKKTGAMSYLMAKLIEEFSNQDVLFDFGGSSVPTLARFFKGYGATDHFYFSFKKNNLPMILKWLK